MPRPASAGVPVKSAVAARAGGYPASSDEGAGPLPLFAPATTTTAMPTAIAATIGTARPDTQLRDRMAAAKSLPRRAAKPCSAGWSAG